MKSNIENLNNIIKLLIENSITLSQLTEFEFYNKFNNQNIIIYKQLLNNLNTPLKINAYCDHKEFWINKYFDDLNYEEKRKYKFPNAWELKPIYIYL